MPGNVVVERFRGLLVGLAVSAMVFAGVVPAQAANPVTVLHVFLAVGQSNMSGRGLPIGGARDPVDPRIFQYGAKVRTLRPATVPLDMHDKATGISPATTLAREYLKTQAGNVGVLIIPAAHGATAFTSAANTLTWSVGKASAPKFDLPTLAVAQAREGIAAAKAAGFVVDLKGILWHQGEHNSTMSTAEYSTRLDELIAFFRSKLAAPKLPFVVGQMTPEGIADTPSRANVDRAHRGTPARVPYTGYAAATTGGVNAGDRIHFSRVGIEYLGKTYLSAYRKAAAAGGGTSPPGAGAPGGNVPAAASTAIGKAAVANPGIGKAAALITCGLPGGGCRQEYQRGAIIWSPATSARTSVGGIRATWAAAGAEGGRLGYPTSNEACGLRNGGCYQMFQGGAIIWSPATGSRLSIGGIRTAWAAAGLENGRLGYPTSNEVCGLRNGGCQQLFQGGAILWSPTTGSRLSIGGIRAAWAATGYQNGRLGYPTSDEFCGLRSGGCQQLFQGGAIIWSPATGSQLSVGAIRAAWAAYGLQNGRLGYPTTNEYRMGGDVAQNYQGGRIVWSPASGARIG